MKTTKGTVRISIKELDRLRAKDLDDDKIAEKTKEQVKELINQIFKRTIGIITILHIFPLICFGINISAGDINEYSYFSLYAFGWFLNAVMFAFYLIARFVEWCFDIHH